MKYFRHFPLAFWAVLSLLLGGLLYYANSNPVPVAPTRTGTAFQGSDHATVQALLTRLSTVHAAAAPPASGLASWASETAATAIALADARGGSDTDPVVAGYRGVAAAALGLAGVDPANREQILVGIASLGAAGTRLGASVNGVTLPVGTAQNLDESALSRNEVTP